MATQLLLIAAFVASMILMSLNYKKRKKKVMFISGASIEKALAPGSYISHLAEILKKENVDDKYDLLKAGIRSGNIHDVFERIEVEVLDKGPDIVVINFSITDMMDWFFAEKKEFEAFYKSIIKRLIDAKISIIICLPIITSNEAYNLTLRGIDWTGYLLTIRDVATKTYLPIIDLQKLNLNNGESHLDEGKIIAKEVWNKLGVI